MARDILTPFHPLVKNFGALPSSTQGYPTGSYFLDTSTPASTKLYVSSAGAFINVPLGGSYTLPAATTTTLGGIEINNVATPTNPALPVAIIKEETSATPGANLLLRAGSLGTIAAGWLPVSTTSAIGGVRINSAFSPTLPSAPTTIIVEEVATGNQANKIPRAGGGGTIATGWLPAATSSANGTVEINNAFSPTVAANPVTIIVEETSTTSAASKIPRANGSGVIDKAWLPTADGTNNGATKLSVAPASAGVPIAVGDNDTRMTNSRTPIGTAGGDLGGTYPNPAVNFVGTATSTAVANAALLRHTQNTDTGTTSTTFQLNSGGSGSKLKDSSGVVVRNAADSADVNFQANQLNASGGYIQLAGGNYVQGGSALPGSGSYNGQAWYKNSTTPGTSWVWDSTGVTWIQFTTGTVTPAAKIRVLNDTTTRAAGYSNTAVQVTGVGGIPSFAKSVFVMITHFATAVGDARIVLDNPDSPTGATVIAQYIPVIGNYLVQMSQISLSTTGKLSYTILGSSVGYSHFIIDVVSYLI